MIIHPNQIDQCNDMFIPTEEEQARARGIVEAYDRSSTVGNGATALNGEMIDYATLQRARATLARGRTGGIADDRR